MKTCRLFVITISGIVTGSRDELDLEVMNTQSNLLKI